MPEATVTPRGQRKVRVGLVVSNKMRKTIIVRVNRLMRHQQYHRVIKRGATFHVHDETNSAAIGDSVKIMETRPLSRHKRWRLVEILQRASTAPPLPDAETDASRSQRVEAPAVSPTAEHPTMTPAHHRSNPATPTRASR